VNEELHTVKVSEVSLLSETPVKGHSEAADMSYTEIWRKIQHSQ
jgi:hypothetical protein